MNPTLTTPSRARFAALSVVTGLLLLAACSPGPATTPVPAPLTASPEIVLPLIGGGDEGSGGVTPSPTSPAQPAEPASEGTAPATTRADISPPPTPTPMGPEPSRVEADAASAEPAPDFTLESAQGEVVTLSDYQGLSTVVLVFYRGQT